MNAAADQLSALQAYFELMNLNGAARVYHAAQELGVHDALRKGAASAADVAGACGLQEAPAAPPTCSSVTAANGRSKPT